jgi:hypothetical protein
MDTHGPNPHSTNKRRRRQILDGNPDTIIGSPVSVLDSMHTADVKDGNHYFDVGEDDWDDVSEREEPLTWSIDEPGTLSDWTVEVTRVPSPPSFQAGGDGGVVARFPGRDRHNMQNKHAREQPPRPVVQSYHVHKAILSAG